MAESQLPEEELFYRVLSQPKAERDAFIIKCCEGNRELALRLRALLEAHDDQENFIGASLLSPLRARVNVTNSDVSQESPGDRIGRYKLLAKIGEGGCGVVYMAEQQEPVQRKVALKIIKLGMDTKAVIGRFEAERQTLALMDHTSIARVFDGGATATGRPFFVMELVEGLPITKYCDQQNLETAARLELFNQVCHAVQHAHQKGIIHRDLKPSNILVTIQDGRPIPKVIDFGIAKATQGRRADSTWYTAVEQFIGTPAYMSPEQAQLGGLDVDTRSDIYSLGVLLYELLTGHSPFEQQSLLSAGIEEICRIIREDEPPRPSSRLSTLSEGERNTVSRNRGVTLNELASELRGDLDWIVMRCLEKDRARRYESANDLATDLGRYLKSEPVAARPPSTAYLLSRLYRRHRLPVLAGIGILVTLLIGLSTSTWQAIRATQAERLADSRLASELSERKEVEAQRQLAMDRLAAEQAARAEAERQKTVAEQERSRAQNAEELAAQRLQSELAARRESEDAKSRAEQQRTLAEQQKAVAEEERNRAQKAEFAAQLETKRTAEAARLMQAMLKGAGPHVALVSDLDLLHRVLDYTAQLLVTDPSIREDRQLRNALSTVYYVLGDYSASTAIGGNWTGKEHPPLALALNQLGTALTRHNKLAEAESILKQAIEVDRLVSVTGNTPSTAAFTADLEAVVEKKKNQGRSEIVPTTP